MYFRKLILFLLFSQNVNAQLPEVCKQLSGDFNQHIQSSAVFKQLREKVEDIVAVIPQPVFQEVQSHYQFLKDKNLQDPINNWRLLQVIHLLGPVRLLNYQIGMNPEKTHILNEEMVQATRIPPSENYVIALNYFGIIGTSEMDYGKIASFPSIDIEKEISITNQDLFPTIQRIRLVYPIGAPAVQIELLIQRAGEFMLPIDQAFLQIYPECADASVLNF